ncbi:YopT-type cysteine protease domain-containing protein [Microbulbifer sp. JTAC008]|uniref:YopT-type cysteine protease domain-containing protein n=1 Tax=unclassified Microbulbifer TaxID=2619833 RepID=UPI0040399843
MPLWMNRTARDTRRIIERVILAARARGCIRVVEFSQSPGSKIHTVLTKRGVGDGICIALALYWLEGQIKNRDYLGPMVGQNKRVIADALSPAIELFNATKAANSQMKDAHLWMNTHGFVGNMPRKEYVNRLRNWVGDYCCQGPDINQFRIISTRSFHSHTMALDLENLIFFDPNIGTFQFNYLAHLRNFLSDVIFPYGVGGREQGAQYLGRKVLHVLEMGSYSRDPNLNYFMS